MQVWAGLLFIGQVYIKRAENLSPHHIIHQDVGPRIYLRQSWSTAAASCLKDTFHMSVHTQWISPQQRDSMHCQSKLELDVTTVQWIAQQNVSCGILTLNIQLINSPWNLSVCLSEKRR